MLLIATGSLHTNTNTKTIQMLCCCHTFCILTEAESHRSLNRSVLAVGGGAICLAFGAHFCQPALIEVTDIVIEIDIEIEIDSELGQFR